MLLCLIILNAEFFTTHFREWVAQKRLEPLGSAMEGVWGVREIPPTPRIIHYRIHNRHVQHFQYTQYKSLIVREFYPSAQWCLMVMDNMRMFLRMFWNNGNVLLKKIQVVFFSRCLFPPYSLRAVAVETVWAFSYDVATWINLCTVNSNPSSFPFLFERKLKHQMKIFKWFC